MRVFRKDAGAHDGPHLLQPYQGLGHGYGQQSTAALLAKADATLARADALMGTDYRVKPRVQATEQRSQHHEDTREEDPFEALCKRTEARGREPLTVTTGQHASAHNDGGEAFVWNDSADPADELRRRIAWESTRR